MADERFALIRRRDQWGEFYTAALYSADDYASYTTGMVASRFQRALVKLTLGDLRVLFGVESIGPPTVVSLPMSFESP